MATVTITFEDGDEEQMITFNSTTGISYDDDIEKMTNAEYMASMSLLLLKDYLNAIGARTSDESEGLQ